MYSQDDLEAAVQAGILPQGSAQRIRAFVEARRHAPVADEEEFRLVNSFNDIFVALASVLTLGAIAFLLRDGGGRVPGLPTLPGGPLNWPAAVAVGATAWGLAEYFTRRRRMALPSLVLAAAFILAAGWVAGEATWRWLRLTESGPGLAGSAALAGACLGAALHWRRFRVPVTMAGLILAGIGSAIFLLMLLPVFQSRLDALILAGGCLAFAAALAWDASDPARLTRRSDVALWLHLGAAPMIVHPLFSMLGLLQGNGGTGTALATLALYAGFALVALATDRRALLVAALAYVVWAVGSLLGDAADRLGVVLPLATLAIGAALLLLSAVWRSLRRPLLALLGPALRRALPPG